MQYAFRNKTNVNEMKYLFNDTKHNIKYNIVQKNIYKGKQYVMSIDYYINEEDTTSNKEIKQDQLRQLLKYKYQRTG